MADRYKMMRAFNALELSLIGDALEKFIGEGGFSDRILDVLLPLQEDITFARRMLHQIGKSDHRDR